MSTLTIDELKERVSIEEVLIECGARVQTQAWGSDLPVWCPFHLNQDTPAGSVNLTKGLYHCFGCGAGGSVIDLALLHLSTTSIKEACDWLEETFCG